MLSVGDYEYDKRDTLGNGSFAIVYKGRSTKEVELTVAIKVVKKQRLYEANTKVLLQKEVQVLKELASVEHENVVKLLAFDTNADNMYLVLEYCNKGDLADYLRAIKSHRLSERTVYLFLRQVASAMRTLHNKDIVHRDLKPQNLLLCSRVPNPRPHDLLIKIADFGLARFLPADDMAKTLCGSPIYMAPEVLLAQTYDGKADLWSLGVIFYQCLFNQVPFQTSTQEQLRNYYKNKKELKVNFPQGVSADLVDLLTGLLTKAPLDRISFENFFVHRFIMRVEPTEEKRAAKASVSTPSSPQPDLGTDLLSPMPRVGPRRCVSQKDLKRYECLKPSASRVVSVSKSPPGLNTIAPRQRKISSPAVAIPSPLEEVAVSAETQDVLPKCCPPRSAIGEDYVMVDRDGEVMDSKRRVFAEASCSSSAPSDSHKYVGVGEASSNFSTSDGSPSELSSPRVVLRPKNRKTSSPAIPDVRRISVPEEYYVAFTNERSRNYSCTSLSRRASASSRPLSGSPMSTPPSTPTPLSSRKQPSLLAPQDHIYEHHRYQDSLGGGYFPPFVESVSSTGFQNYDPDPFSSGVLDDDDNDILNMVAPALSEDILYSRQHCDTFKKLEYLYMFSQCVSQMADRSGHLAFTPIALHNATGFSLCSASSHVAKLAATTATSRHALQHDQCLLEQLVLYMRVIDYLHACAVTAKQEIAAGNLAATANVKRLLSDIGTLYHRAHQRSLELRKQIDTLQTLEELAITCRVLPVEQLIYNYAFQLCKVAAWDEMLVETEVPQLSSHHQHASVASTSQFVSPSLRACRSPTMLSASQQRLDACLSRYRTAFHLIYGLSQQENLAPEDRGRFQRTISMLQKRLKLADSDVVGDPSDRLIWRQGV